MITPQQQIECVRRELLYRQRVYARLVARGLMTADVAAYEMDAMNAVLRTLCDVNDLPCDPVPWVPPRRRTPVRQATLAV
jgi:hypothetical protein